MKNASFSILFASIYLLVFLLLLHTEFIKGAWTLFLISPFVVIYMVYTVIRYGEYSGKELEEGEEWRYEDMNKEDL